MKFGFTVSVVSAAIALVALSGCKSEEKALTQEEVLAQLSEEKAAKYAHNAAISDFLDQFAPLPHHDETWPDYQARMKERGIVFEFIIPKFSEAHGDFLANERLVVAMCDETRERIKSASFDTFDPAKMEAVVEQGLKLGLLQLDVLSDSDREHDITERYSVTKEYVMDVLDQHPGMMNNMSCLVTRYLESGRSERAMLLSKYFSC